jgi:hypothetical protein
MTHVTDTHAPLSPVLAPVGVRYTPICNLFICYKSGIPNYLNPLKSC